MTMTVLLKMWSMTVRFGVVDDKVDGLQKSVFSKQISQKFSRIFF
jgi:hypothetical protein